MTNTKGKGLGKRKGLKKKKKPSKPKKLTNKNEIKNKTKLAVDKQKIPRHKERYPALNFKRQVKTRLDQLDMDYIDKLSEAEKAWLNSFLEETVITNFDHKGKKLYKSKKAKKEFYGTNNARNRCMFTKAKAMNTIVNTKNPEALAAMINGENTDTASDIEDGLIAEIYLKKFTEET